MWHPFQYLSVHVTFCREIAVQATVRGTADGTATVQRRYIGTASQSIDSQPEGASLPPRSRGWGPRARASPHTAHRTPHTAHHRPHPAPPQPGGSAPADGGTRGGAGSWGAPWPRVRDTPPGARRGPRGGARGSSHPPGSRLAGGAHAASGGGAGSSRAGSPYQKRQLVGDLMLMITTMITTMITSLSRGAAHPVIAINGVVTRAQHLGHCLQH